MSYEKIKSMTIKEDKDGNVHFKMLVASMLPRLIMKIGVV